MTPEEIREILYESLVDTSFEWNGHEFFMYYDKNHVEVNTGERHVFDKWDQLLKAPIFWGKTLAEIAHDTICHY